MSLGAPALVIAIITMVAFAAIGIGYTRRRKQVTVEDFISARGSIGGISTTATLVASIMGVWILFAPAEAATWAGLIAVIGYGVGQAAPILAFVIVGPRMRQVMPQGHSLSEFAWYRYGRLMYGVTLAIIVFYMFVFLAAEMGAIARAVRLITDAPLLLTLLIVGGATLAYTVYGGLRASIFTDNLQFPLIVPLMVAVLVATLVEIGGWGPAFGAVREVSPELLSATHQPGIELAITLIIAITAANLFHQGFWQRVYASKSDADLRRGFLSAGLIVIPLVVAGGLFGLWAVGQGLSGPSSDPIALFRLALDVLPDFLVVVLMVLALVLVMSSMDTLLNGIASVFTSDLLRLRPQLSGTRLLASSRLITVAFIVPAIVVGFFFDSVLYLFFIADLACAGAVVPVFLGLFVGRLSGRAAAVSTVLGIGAGALFFPTKSLGGWWTWERLTDTWHVLASGNTLASFLIAVVVSTVAALGFVLARSLGQRSQSYDFGELASRVRLIEG